MLQRVYGTAFFDKKDLKAHLQMLEEAKELCSECIKAEIKDLQDKLKIVNNYL